MRFIRSVLPLALLVAPAAVMAGDPPCKTINFGEAVLSAFPDAMRGCHAVKVRDNVVYAQYAATVKSANSDEVTVIFQDYEGKDMTKIKFAPGDVTAKIDGKTVQFANLSAGTKLHFYIPQDRWSLFSDPGSPELKVLSREEL